MSRCRVPKSNNTKILNKLASCQCQRCPGRFSLASTIKRPNSSIVRPANQKKIPFSVLLAVIRSGIPGKLSAWIKSMPATSVNVKIRTLASELSSIRKVCHEITTTNVATITENISSTK